MTDTMSKRLWDARPTSEPETNTTAAPGPVTAHNNAAARMVASWLVAMNVHRRREARGWSYEDLASRARVHAGRIVDLERGAKRRSAHEELLRAIATALGVPLNELLRWD